MKARVILVTSCLSEVTRVILGFMILELSRVGDPGLDFSPGYST